MGRAAPHSDGGQYVNFPGLGEDGEAQGRVADAAGFNNYLAQ